MSEETTSVQRTELEIVKSILTKLCDDGLWGWEEGRLGIDGRAFLDEEESAWFDRFCEEDQ